MHSTRFILHLYTHTIYNNNSNNNNLVILYCAAAAVGALCAEAATAAGKEELRLPLRLGSHIDRSCKSDMRSVDFTSRPHTHILLMWCVQYTVYIVWSNKASCIVATIRKKRRKRIKFDAKFPIRPGYKPRFIEDSKRIAFNKGGHNRKQERWRAMDISSHYYARGHKRRKLFLPISLIHILFFFIVKHEFM